MNPRPAVDEFIKTYGPFAFGVASLLIIWFSIIAPELDRKQLDFETHRKLIEQQNNINLKSEETIKALRDTAVILDRVMDKIGALEDANGQ